MSRQAPAPNVETGGERPGYGPGPRDDRSQEFGRIIVIVAAVLGAAAVLMIVMTLVLAGLLHSLVVGPPPDFEMEGSGWQSGSYNATVTQVRDAHIEWRDLRLALVTFEGAAYFRGESGLTQYWEEVRTTATYHDEDLDGLVSVGDRIQVRVEPADAADLFERGVLSASTHGRSRGSLGL